MKLKKLLPLLLTILLISCNVHDSRLVILHTNDTHSQVEPDKSDKAGYARRMGVINNIRQNEKNVLLVDAGDFCQGTPYFNFFKGRVEVEALNRMGYEAVTLGNHEFDNGLDSLAAILSLAKFPIVCANYDVKGTVLEGLVKPYTVINKRGIKVGIIGLGVSPESLISMHNFLPVRYLDPLPIADSLATYLRYEEGCDIVVCLSHLGTHYDGGQVSDEVIAKHTHDIDIIIGGHTHKVYCNHFVENLDGRQVLLSQTGKTGARLGCMTLQIDSLRQIGSISEEMLDIDSTTDSIADTAYPIYLEPYKQEVENKLNYHLGDAPEDMIVARPESNMLNWAADALLEMARIKTNQDVDMSVVNIGGLRCNWPAGEITLRNVFELMPFDNELVILTLTGEDLIDLAKAFASQGGQGMSGMEIEIKNNKLKNATLAGHKIVPQMLYRVATSDYLSDGKDHLDPLGRHSSIIETHEVIRDLYIEYIKLHPVVEAPLDGRTKVLD